MIRQSDPVSFAQYSQMQELLCFLRWNRFKACDRIHKRVKRKVKQANSILGVLQQSSDLELKCLAIGMILHVFRQGKPK